MSAYMPYPGHQPPLPPAPPDDRKAACMCCGNLLKFPSTVTCYRCTVCDTVTDLIPLTFNGPMNDANGMPLTLARVKELCENSDDRHLERVVFQVFSTHALLNLSFRNSEPLSLKNSGVILGDVREALMLICDKGHQMQTALMAAIDRLLRRPGSPMSYLADMPFLLILLENPLNSLSGPGNTDYSYHHGILSRLLGILSCLTNDLHHHMVMWFKQLPYDVFQRRVSLLNYFIAYRLSHVEGARESYPTDWTIKSASRVMALLSAANSQREHALPMAEFYNTLVDYVNLHRDFKIWQGDRTGCYPFLISLGAKMQIMEADAKRQMAERFKEAFFKTALHGLHTDPFLSLHVRRTSLIEDSLNQLQSQHFDLKKKLRIEFVNEAGVDAGGLTKEWFLLLVRDLFDPQYGMFTYDEDSQLCWFNPASFENNEEFRLVGTIVGLAIHNSNILDVHFPPAVYKKLLDYPVSLDDLKTLRPALGRGLESLLSYPGDDVETVFCRDFVAEYEAFGDIIRVPLVPNGDRIPVTNDNRKEYVAKYVDWALNGSVDTQFQAFKLGFGYVCGGNALSLFKPSEIELMVCGGTELDIRGLEGVTEYEGFTPTEPTIRWFWDIVNGFTEDHKRRLLFFVTGTDRIPATGIQGMTFKISCMGEDSEALPISHTCFNQVCIYRYSTQEKLAHKLEQAMTWSSGFHVK
ncbi:putative E3 ubiquitin-protein ligase [Geranomyces michiganensis]|nr:putative E3 ubiquitin-protein ligase [Geranomyces michiganensis]